MTEIILPDCSSRSSVKQVDNEVTKRNRCHVFQELITMLRCCIQAKVLSLSLQEQESNIKIYIRKYSMVSWWEEIKAWHKESRARMTLYNASLPCVKFSFQCNVENLFNWKLCHCAEIFDYVMLLLVSQSWYNIDHDYSVGYIHIFK